MRISRFNWQEQVKNSYPTTHTPVRFKLRQRRSLVVENFLPLAMDTTMNTGIIIVLLAVLIAVGFIRARPKSATVSSIDRLFVGLVVFAVMLPAVIAGPLLQRSSSVPWTECTMFFVATIAVSCFPLCVAQFAHRYRVGRWWTSSSYKMRHTENAA